MRPRRILFISGSGGLGHVTRDLAMARALRQAVSGVEIRWLAAPPASGVLQEAGEQLLPQAAHWADETVVGADMLAAEKRPCPPVSPLRPSPTGSSIRAT